ncbi:MAG: hypothetical protein ONB49_13985 [candidate division KSB1 bacterium]|nr:hypothetical protein [candidate division KSB1 bacterium]
MAAAVCFSFCDTAEMASSHQMKRFFRKFLAVPNRQSRQILLVMFLWRLRIGRPGIVVLVGGVVVLADDGIRQREGMGPSHTGTKRAVSRWRFGGTIKIRVF